MVSRGTWQRERPFGLKAAAVPRIIGMRAIQAKCLDCCGVATAKSANVRLSNVHSGRFAWDLTPGIGPDGWNRRHGASFAVLRWEKLYYARQRPTRRDRPHEPPTIAETLALENRELVERIDALAASARKCAVIDLDSAGKATLLVIQINKTRKKTETAREAAKKPHLESGRKVDAFF